MCFIFFKFSFNFVKNIFKIFFASSILLELIRIEYTGHETLLSLIFCISFSKSNTLLIFEIKPSSNMLIEKCNSVSISVFLTFGLNLLIISVCFSSKLLFLSNLNNNVRSSKIFS